MLKQKFEEIGIDGDACKPGQYYGLTCPSCKGGDSEEKSLSLHITKDGAAAMWTCFRAKCGWRGTTRAFAAVKSTYAKMSRIAKAKQPFREITEESLELEPLCNELLAYFAERMISGETLQRNSVMQKRRGNQETNTEKIFYGLDNIKGASDIMIVEGEMNKLAMEEAGFKNCVSMLDGAPPKVSNRELPSAEEETNTEKIFYGLDNIKGASDIMIVEGEMNKLAMEEAGFKNCVSDDLPRGGFHSNRELPSAEEVVPGELTIVTGVPNSGKSEWIDALLCNLNRSVGWKFALCSMENKVCVRKVRNKVIGTIGDGYLSYNRVIGEYMDFDR
ncbi:unnamed protein product [Fraxinus pennsylvanica]|uniref:Uncharacterized protein n=1 Tax=Fraxinus pennsylvanica TaxID=56036 RepID=A0AAD1YZE8_9LAMI|nr:unnamed protein product [Fraxinus pennsylvanica]